VTGGEFAEERLFEHAPELAELVDRGRAGEGQQVRRAAGVEVAEGPLAAAIGPAR
jgi:hypothetical protein